jgi:hypothetical protein
MKTDLLAAKYKMKTYFRDAGQSHCLVLDLAKDLQADDMATIWGNDDPTLPLANMFDMVAITVGHVKKRVGLVEKKRPGCQLEMPAAKRSRRDLAPSGNDGQGGSERGGSGRWIGGTRGMGQRG